MGITRYRYSFVTITLFKSMSNDVMRNDLVQRKLVFFALSSMTEHPDQLHSVKMEVWAIKKILPA
jgi:hypothetical protein